MFKRIMVAVAFGLMAIAAQAEATFDQIQTLIQQQQYAAAASGLEGIIQAHPKSAKAFYAMAQAQAGLGNFDKAHKALDIATGLNPTLDFAPASSVASLRQAITPQTAKIEAVETSHFWATFAYFALFAGFAVACYFLYSVYARKQEEDARDQAEEEARIEARVKRMQAQREAEEAERVRQEAEEAKRLAAEAAFKAHKNYGKEGFDPANPDKLKTKKQLKEEKLAEEMLAKARAEAAVAADARRERLRAEAAEDELRRERARAAATPTQTVVHTNNGGNDMLTGVLIGNMMGGSHHSHDTTVIRETVREVEVPAKAPKSSWDDIGSSKSEGSGYASKSSWDDDSSSRSSSSRSSWDSDSSSSSSSSSWSSSSSSDSSSSWSSSSSDSSSSSSWD